MKDEKYIKKLEDQISILKQRQETILNDINAFQKHNEIMFWELFKKQGEDLLEAKKRFFRSLSLDDDFIKLKQEGNLILLKQFVSICERLNLKYWLCAGSVLGAVRHSGFIPWDDDVDVTMPREDLNKFLSYVKQDKNFATVKWYNFFAGDKITKLVFREHKTLWFLDIFSCDEIFGNPKLAAQLYVKYKHKLITEIRNNQVLKPVLKRKEYDCYLNQKFVDEFDRIFNNNNNLFLEEVKARCVGNELIGYVCSLEDPENSMVQVGNYQLVSDLFPLTKIKFQDVEVYTLKNYEKYVKQKYIDYLSLPKDIFTHEHVQLDISFDQLRSESQFLDNIKEKL